MLTRLGLNTTKSKYYHIRESVLKATEVKGTKIKYDVHDVQSFSISIAFNAA